MSHKGDYVKAMNFITSVSEEKWQSVSNPFEDGLFEILEYDPLEYHTQIDGKMKVLVYMPTGEEVAVCPEDEIFYLEILKQLEEGSIEDSDDIVLVDDPQFNQLIKLIWEVFALNRKEKPKKGGK